MIRSCKIATHRPEPVPPKQTWFKPEVFLSIAVFSTLCCTPSAHATRQDDQMFVRYAVKTTFHGKPVSPLLNSPVERTFRTRIREGVRKGVVFADHYSVATWGCGGGCIQFAIIDAVTGRVYVFPYTVSQVRETGELLTYHRNSRAVHIVGSLDEKNSADRWYVWDKDKLNLISEKPARLSEDDGGS